MPNPIPKLDHAIEVATLKYEIRQLLNAIKEHWEQKADDRCIEDDDKLYKAAGLPPCDRHVGDKTAMLVNCARFIEKRCEGGKWPSYVELERLCKTLIKGMMEYAQWEARGLSGLTPKEKADAYFVMMRSGVEALVKAKQLFPEGFEAVKEEIAEKNSDFESK